MSAPLLSVVVASVNGRPYIDACLASLHNQEHVHSAQFNNPKSKINNPKSQIQNQQSQIIVVDRVGEGVTRFVQRDYPAVCLIATDSVFPNCKSLAELRAIGIKAARGQVIAITEDHCIAPPNWFAAILQAHNDHPPDATHPPDAIGGAVDNAATGRLLDRAVYLTEYVEFASPVPRGPVSQLPAANVSYKRPALEAMRTSLARGYHETALHQQMIEAGYLLWSDPSIVILHKKHFRLSGYLSERYHFSRWFAGSRFADEGFVRMSRIRRRVLYLLLTPALPFLILFRLTKRAIARNYARQYLTTLPLIFLFAIVWAVGEFAGYLLGPGQSAHELL